jgi:hypothetical protein
MLVDACVWLDLARDPCAPALMGALEELIGAATSPSWWRRP